MVFFSDCHGRFCGRHAGAAVGAVDGMVYLGTVFTLVIGLLVLTGDEAKNPPTGMPGPISWCRLPLLDFSWRCAFGMRCRRIVVPKNN